jgi:hypothetical protein
MRQQQQQQQQWQTIAQWNTLMIARHCCLVVLIRDAKMAAGREQDRSAFAFRKMQTAGLAANYHSSSSHSSIM